MKMQLTEIARALRIEVKAEYEDICITSVSFDSRTLKAGALFIPLVAGNDGHNFIESAQKNGAVATLWQADHESGQTRIPQLVVSDTLAALQTLGRYYLDKINPKVVAITGSNGKTTTKDMVAAILGSQFNVQKTHANYNNHIGVPMTILGMEPNTEILVVEMGMDYFGELDHLSRLASPDVAVITMIGEAHIEFFGSRDKIADAKMEITHGLKEDGTLVYNGDEPLLRKRTEDLNQATVTFGRGEGNDLQATNIVSDDVQTGFRVVSWPEENFTIPMIGAYNVNNALAALAVGNLFHVPVEAMRKALANFDLTANRTEWVKGAQGERILSDVYNSNPTAVKQVLQAFTKVETNGKRIVVLGDMLELGEQAELMHTGLAAYIQPEEITEVYLCGPIMSKLAQVLEEKYAPEKIHHYETEDKDSLVADLKATINPEDIVMIKGSHGIHLEEVLAALQK